jgi:hypothetical protein
MMRRTLSVLILLSMVLHCASRLGVLSYLYENRNQIANTMGLISEVPIAMCSSDYDFNEGLHIQHADTHPSAPATFLTAHEITLFAQAFVSFNLRENSSITDEGKSRYSVGSYQHPPFEIFQPPRIS